MSIFKKLANRFKKASTWRWILFFLLLVAPILIYVIRFHSFSISDDPSDWADFGSYLGGVYTVLVTFLAIILTRHYERKDVEWKKSKEAASELFEQITKIDYQKVNDRSVSRLLNLTVRYELYIPTELYNKLTDLHDDYLEAKSKPQSFNIQKEIQIKSWLKRLYES